MDKELSLFPDLNKKNKETLFIIGNGFDISHGIKSRYSDFRDWLISQKKNNLVGLMDIFFSNERDVWGNLEAALGEYDEGSVLSYCRPDEEFDFDHSLSSAARVEDSPNAIFLPVLEDFKDCFKEWVDSINLIGVQKEKHLPIDALYLTFNYTDTLETIYGIPPHNIAHIHGSRQLNDEYIIGHNNTRNPSDAWDDECLDFECQAKENIINWMNELVKNYRDNIRKHQDFFNRIINVKQIITYGHSMSEIDWPYFEEIISKIGRDIPWRVSCFSENDVANAKKFQSCYNLTNLSIIYNN